MKSFLDYVAEDMLSKHGGDLHNVRVVFPGKRAALFFNECLIKAAGNGRPVWAPQYITISELMGSCSQLTVANDIRLVCELYEVFKKHTETDETLDHFYGWGQRLLQDFDDIDKNLAPAERIFQNLSDLHELDTIEYLTPQQREAITHFFGTLKELDNDSVRRRFLMLWSKLGDIYREFRNRLHKQGLAYEGMLYREVAENFALSPKHSSLYIFVGFNLVQPVEQAVFKQLQTEGRARFYWDFDNFYTNGNHEAGNYVREYLKLFPNELNCQDDDIYNNFTKHKEITYVGSPTEDLEARYIAKWIREQKRNLAGRRTAIVLCNENLLPTVIHCLPPEVGEVNCTGGYPLFLSPVYSLLQSLIALQMHTRTQRRHTLRRISEHPYAPYLNLEPFNAKVESAREMLASLAEAVSTIATSYADADQFTQEALFKAYTILTALHNEAETGRLDIGLPLLGRILRQIFRSTKIQFHGEPLAGVQIMGVLETRNLDFDHVLILSCNEGTMPPTLDDASFIPYSLRKAYGLTTIDNKTDLYSFYFHRLLQRAGDITLVYRNATSTRNSGEMSPFMLCLLVEAGHNIKQISLRAAQNLPKLEHFDIPKEGEVLKLLNGLDHLSPSAINTYLRCPIQFYFNVLKGLKEPQTNETDADSRTFGNIFHHAAQLVYQPLPHRLCADDIKQLIKNEQAIEKAVEQAIRDEAKQESDSGLRLITRQVHITLLRHLLEFDLSRAPFTLQAAELTQYHDFCVNTPDGKRKIKIGGIIDRIDRLDDRLLVVDYKTGAAEFKNNIADMETVFSRNGNTIAQRHTDYALQTLLYSVILLQSRELNPARLPVSPALLFIQHASGKGYDPILRIGKQQLLLRPDDMQEFQRRLQELLEEILNPAIPFSPNPSENICKMCAYANLCTRVVHTGCH